MDIKQFHVAFKTSGRGTQDVTNNIKEALLKTSVKQGLCNIFLKHTSASLMLCENYDIQVRNDLENFLARLVPDGDPLFRHVIEGKDDMPAHIRSLLTQTSINLPIYNSQLDLGTWQGIYLYEHRYQPHERHMVVTVIGE